MERTYYTYRLYARPSFLEGVARVLDLGGTLNEYDTGRTGTEADALAIWSDWAAIGQDIRCAMGVFKEEHTEALHSDD